MTFCHSTAFSEGMMRAFAHVTELMEIGSVVITCTKPLPTTNSRWLTLFHDRLDVAWGTVKVWAYEKLTTEVGAGLLAEMAAADAAPAGLGAADGGLGAAEEGPTILNAGQNMLLSPPRPSRKASVTVEEALGLAKPLSFSPPPDVGLITTPLEDIPISPAFMPQLPKGLQNLPEAAKRRLLQRMVKEQMEFQERAKIAAAMGQEDLAGDGKVDCPGLAVALHASAHAHSPVPPYHPPPSSPFTSASLHCTTRASPFLRLGLSSTRRRPALVLAELSLYFFGLHRPRVRFKRRAIRALPSAKLGSVTWPRPVYPGFKNARVFIPPRTPSPFPTETGPVGTYRYLVQPACRSEMGLCASARLMAAGGAGWW